MSIGKKIAGGFALALGILVIIGSLSFRNTQKLIETNRWVNHTYQVLESVELLMSLLIDEETRLRGFLLTENKEFIKLYESNVREAATVTAELKKKTGDNSRQQQRLRELDELIATRAAYTQNTIDIAQTSDPG